MKNLLKFLSPFAPDQSGAVSVLFELGGLTVICDAGGCTGNICGFDEPRWQEQRSALFSAGLRDMDAVLGRDDKLIEKLVKAVGQTDVKFTSVVGTPCPAIIATDYRALKRMAEKKTALPCITVDCTGTRYYDEGAEKALYEVFRTFVDDKVMKENKTGILGASPLDISNTKSDELVKNVKLAGYDRPICFTMGSGLEDIISSAGCSKNIVVAPWALKTAEYMKERFDIPYEVHYPSIPENVKTQLMNVKGKGLIVHQQVIANEVRKFAEENSDAECVCASWFMMKKQLAQPDDVKITGEQQFAEIVNNGNFNFIVGDKAFKKLIRGFEGNYIDYPHFAVSGRLSD